MALFDNVVAAAMAGRTIGACPLVFFDFLDDPRRLWPGYGTLNAGGYEWAGSGDLGAIEGLSAATTDAAQAVTFRLTGVTAEMQGLAAAADTRVKGRGVTVYALFTDAATGAALADPAASWAGYMDVMTFAASGPTSRQITLTAEGENSDRRRPRFGLMTDSDQQARYPGDTGLRFRPALKSKTLRAPW